MLKYFKNKYREISKETFGEYLRHSSEQPENSFESYNSDVIKLIILDAKRNNLSHDEILKLYAVNKIRAFEREFDLKNYKMISNWIPFIFMIIITLYVLFSL